jgi:penicillin-binding protein 1A
MANQPNNGSNSMITQLMTKVIHNIPVALENPILKPNAKVPTLYIKYQRDGKPYSFSRALLGDRYTIGRSRSQSDIVIRSEIVSNIHCVIEKDPQNPKQFIIKDSGSTNGVYCGQNSYQSISLSHNDVITLAPPDLVEAVEIKFCNAPAKWVLLLRYSVMLLMVLILSAIAFIGFEWSKYQIFPMPAHTGGKTVIYGDNGKTLLAPRIDTPHRELESLSDFSPYLPNALIASEDSRFLWHFGIDPLGVVRAIVTKKNTGVQQGASTITQQLARSIYPDVGRENNLARKWREMIVATKLEAVYSKNDIIKAYLNRVYLGINLYGFEDAAKFYFEKSAKDLNLSESATLVAMLPAPNSFNPVQDYDTSIGLRNRIIDRMLRLKMISKEEASKTRRSIIEISPKAKQTFSETIAPYFYSYVYKEMNKVLGSALVNEGDFIVETSLNTSKQAIAESSLKEHLNSNGKQNNFSQGAMVTLNGKTGEIIALVGGKDYQESQFNRAIQAKRQPASTFKAFAYAAALEKGISSGKLYSCAPIQLGGFQYRGCERSGGSIDMSRGFALSENAIALRVAKDAGLKNVASLAQKLGIESELEAVPGLVLGQSEVNVLEITGAYTASPP